MSGSLFSQDCLNDVYYTLVNQNNPGKAKKQFDKGCMTGNEGNASVWLMKGNVYLMYYFNEMDEEKKNPSYRMKDSTLILDAYEAFKKALELNPSIEPMSRLFTPIQGQEKCATPIYMLGDRYRKVKDYDKALDCYLKAQTAYKITLPKESKPNDNINVFYTNLMIYDIYRSKKDKENYSKYLRDSYAYKELNEKFIFVYEDRYALYLNDGDTNKIANLIERAYKKIPDSLGFDKRFRINLLELNFLYLTKQNDSLKVLALSVINSIGIDSTKKYDLTDVMQYLVNINAEDELQSIINQYLIKYENEIEMIKFKSRIFLKKALDLDDVQEKVRLSNMNNNEKIKRQNEIVVERKNILAEALVWYEKAYKIAPNDIEVIKNLYRIKKQNYLPVEPELEKKFQDIMNPSTPQ